VTKKTGPSRRRQVGAAVVEFAIISVVFFTLLIGIMEMGRTLFYWNMFTELTRMGARWAAVCDPGDPLVVARMTAAFPSVPADRFEVYYSPAGCDVNTCELVTVHVLPGFQIANMIPFVPAAVNSITMPEFMTTIPRESMQNTYMGTANPICG
jgi:hypothetical protein